MRMLMCRVSSLALVLAAPAALAEPAETAPTPTPIAADRPVAEEPVPFGFDFLPYAGSSSHAPARRRVVSLNLIGGLSGGIDAFELGLVFNVDQGLVSGLQLAGALNLVLADLAGVQWAGVANVVTGEVRGAQAAPINYARGRVLGGQLGALNLAGPVVGLQAGALDIASGRVLGLQLGALNIADGEAQGLQASALNIAGRVRGAQLAAVNVVGGDVRGAQIGALNVTDGGVRGAQIGTLNIASGPVDGLQLGVINVARRADVGIGVLNLYWDGWSDADVVGNESGMLLAGVRHGSGALYNVYYVGSHLSSEGSDLVAGLGLGGRVPLGPRVELALDVVNLWMARGADYDGILNLSSLRPQLSWRANHALALYLGPTLNIEFAEAERVREVDPLLGDWRIDEDARDHDLRMWFGFVAGIRIF